MAAMFPNARQRLLSAGGRQPARGLLPPVQRGKPTGQCAFKGMRVQTAWREMTSHMKQYLQQVLALGS